MPLQTGELFSLGVNFAIQNSSMRVMFTHDLKRRGVVIS